jgi:hypothetical protein
MKIIKSKRYNKIAQAVNPLDGKSNQQARSFINTKIIPASPGFYSDTSWEGIKKIWEAMDASGIDWNITDNHYLHNEKGIPWGKEWRFEIKFINNRGKPTTLYGVVMASGAGPVNDPLARYDITAYVS